MINKQQTDEDIRKIVVEALEQYNRSESGNWGMCLEYATTHIMKSFSATLSQVRKESYKKGYIDGGLAEIEANAVSDITIAQDKVEQIRTQAYEQGRRDEREQLPSREAVEKAVEQSIIDQHITMERARIIEEVEKYFKGLILIPNPKATKENIINIIKNNDTLD